MPFLIAYWRQLVVIAAIIVLGGLVKWHFVGDDRTVAELKTVQSELLAAQTELKTVQDQFVKATDDAKVLAAQVTSSEQQRLKVQSDLKVTLAALRKQAPPTECKAAVDWAVENKGDLSW